MESKKVAFLNKLSFITLLVTIFLSLFFFLPYVSVTLEASKGFLISIGATLSLFFWLIARLGEGKFSIPKDRLLLIGASIPILFLISSFFSSSFYISLFGSGFEIGTFGSMLIMFIILFLSSMYFQTEKRLWYFIGAIFLGGIILVVFELLNLFLGVERFLPGLMKGIAFGNLVGSWNNFAILLGLITIISLFTIELVHLKKFYKIALYFLLISSLFFLIIINIPLVWLLVGLFSVIIFVYNTSVLYTKVNQSPEGKDHKSFPVMSLVIVLLSIVLLVGNNSIGNLISKYVNFVNPDIRPSVVTTSQIALKSIKHNPLFGTGPNTFNLDWALWQPKEIAQTVFWNLDFSNGYSLLLTFLVTTGILGFLSFVLFLIIFTIRGVQSVYLALKDPFSNYFIVLTFIISIYSWITIIIYNPNIIITTLAFASSGMLIGILVYKQLIPVKEFTFLNDPRHSFFAILGLMILMVSSILLTYVYVQKFTSIVYFSKGMNSSDNDVASLLYSEKMLSSAIILDKNDTYYRNLSQVYLKQLSVIINDKSISEDTLKSELQKLINLSQSNAEMAIKQNSKNYQNYLNLGNIYSSLVPLSIDNSYESAIVAYDKAIELAPSNPSILLAKAQLEFVKENNDGAKEYINQALLLKSDYTDARFLLVQIETNAGNLPNAIRQAEYAGQLNPNDETIFFRLGLLRYNNSDYSGAISAFEKAIYLNNNYLNAHYFLGQAYQKAGRTSDALNQYEMLSKVIPDSEELKKAINSISNISNDTKSNEDEKNITPKKDSKKPLTEKQ